MGSKGNVTDRSTVTVTVWEDETRKQLVRSMDSNPELLKALQIATLLNTDSVRRLREVKTTDEKNALLLEKISKASKAKFLDILRQCGQEHVANIVDKKSDKMPMSEEHDTVLRSKCQEICQFMDSRCGIVGALNAAGVFSSSDAERIKAEVGYYNMASEIINILRRKSDDCFNRFVDKLREYEQDHIVYVLTSGKRGVPPVGSKLLSFMEKKKKDVMDILDSRKSEFLSSLVSSGVFTAKECERVNPCKDGKLILSQERSNEEIWQLLQRKPKAAYEAFVDVLESTGQNYLAAILHYEESANDNQVWKSDALRLMIRSMDSNPELLQAMYSASLLKKDSFKKLSALKSTDERNSQILEKITSADKGKFLEILRQNGQEHVANVVDKKSNKSPMSDVHYKILKGKHEEICQLMDSGCGIVEALRDAVVFSRPDVERIKADGDYYKMTSHMMKILRRKADDSYECFLDQLNEVGQDHIIYVLTSGKEGVPAIDKQLLEFLDEKTKYVVENLDSRNSEFMRSLVTSGALSDHDSKRINPCLKGQPTLTLAQSNDALWQLIKRKPQTSYDKFLNALKSSGQDYIAAVLTGNELKMDQAESSWTEEQRKRLARSMDSNPELLKAMLGAHLLTTDSQQKLRAVKSTDERNSKLLDVITVENNEKFLYILRENGQEHAANIVDKKSDKLPISDERYAVLETKYGEICQFMDPRCGIVETLRSEGVFTSSEAARIIKAEADYYNMTSELIEIIRHKSDDAYSCFVDMLRENGQDHIIYILTSGKEGVPPIGKKLLTFMQSKAGFVEQNMDSRKSEFLPSLVSSDVFTAAECERVNPVKNGQSTFTVAQSNAEIWQLLQRKPKTAYEKFIDALRFTGHNYIASILDEFDKPESAWKEKTLKLLARSLDSNPELLDAASRADLLKKPEVEKLKAVKETDKRNTQLLQKITKENKEKFLEILRGVGQEHVANIVDKKSNKMPMSEEHSDILQAKNEELCMFMDPYCGIVDALHKAGVLSGAEVDRITARAGYHETVSEFINILCRKSDDSFSIFVDKLKECGQEHIIYVLTCGKEGVPPVGKKLPNFMESKTKDVVRNMDSKRSVFLHSLVTNGVLTDQDYERVNLGKDGLPQLSLTRSNDEIWQLLQRKPEAVYKKFLSVLKSTGQNHIHLVLVGEKVSAGVQVKFKNGTTDEAKHRQKIMKKFTHRNDPFVRALTRIEVSVSEVKVDGIVFKLYSQEALEKLQRKLTSGEANALINKEHRKDFLQSSVESVELHANDAEFEKCAEYVRKYRLMTAAHRKACKELIREPESFDRIDITGELLDKLPFIDAQRREMLLGEAAFQGGKRDKMLAEIVQHQPDSAFQQLIDALRDTRQEKLADILEVAAKIDELGKEDIGGRVWEEETRKLLIRAMDSNPELIDALYGAGMLRRDTVEESKKMKSTDERNGFLLKKITKKDKDKFLDILRENGQEHVANIVDRKSDKVEMSDRHWKILQAKFEEICQFIDPGCGIVEALHSAGVLNIAEVERIKLSAGYYKQAAEMINILRRKSDDCYDCFVGKLREFGQDHIAYILTSGKEGIPPIDKKLLSFMGTKKSEVMENMDSRKSEFLPALVSSGVFTDHDCERVNPFNDGRSELTHSQSNDMIWLLLQHKPITAYEKFLDVLKSTGQTSVAMILKGEEIRAQLQVKCKAGVVDEEKSKQKVTQFFTDSNDPFIRALARIGVSVSGINDSGIVLQFYSPRALDKLKKMFSSGEADKLINDRHKVALLKANVESVEIEAADHQFQECAENFEQHRLMTASHRRTCRQLIRRPGMFDKIDISAGLLDKLPFVDGERKTMLEKALESDSHVKLLLEIVHHQPDNAFQQLVEALRETQQQKLSELLEDTAKKNAKWDWVPPGRAHTPKWRYGITRSCLRDGYNTKKVHVA